MVLVSPTLQAEDTLHPHTLEEAAALPVVAMDALILHTPPTQVLVLVLVVLEFLKAAAEDLLPTQVMPATVGLRSRRMILTLQYLTIAIVDQAVVVVEVEVAGITVDLVTLDTQTPRVARGQGTLATRATASIRRPRGLENPKLALHQMDTVAIHLVMDRALCTVEDLMITQVDRHHPLDHTRPMAMETHHCHLLVCGGIPAGLLRAPVPALLTSLWTMVCTT